MTSTVKFLVRVFSVASALALFASVGFADDFGLEGQISPELLKGDAPVVLNFHDHIPEDGDELIPAAPDFNFTPGPLDRLPFRAMGTRLNVAEWVRSGTEYAKSALLAGASANANLTSTFNGMWRSLVGSEIKYPPTGYSFKACGERTLAFAFVGRPGIYLCQRLIENLNYGISDLGQVLVHEAAHTYGIRDECLATTTEILVMRAYAGAVSFQNGYWSNCGFK